MLGLEKNISIGNATQGNRGDRNIPIFNVISFPNRLGDNKLIAVQSTIKFSQQMHVSYFSVLVQLRQASTEPVTQRQNAPQKEEPQG